MAHCMWWPDGVNVTSAVTPQAPHSEPIAGDGTEGRGTHLAQPPSLASQRRSRSTLDGVTPPSMPDPTIQPTRHPQASETARHWGAHPSLARCAPLPGRRTPQRSATGRPRPRPPDTAGRRPRAGSMPGQPVPGAWQTPGTARRPPATTATPAAGEGGHAAPRRPVCPPPDAPRSRGVPAVPVTGAA